MPVKSVKNVLKLILRRKLITYDEFQTVLTKVTATINYNCGFIIDSKHSEIKRNELLMKWKVRNDIQRKFQIRWSTDYLQ